MTDTPWLGDACSLVDAFRSGERKPSDELDAVLAAVEASSLNAVTFVDEEGARAVAQMTGLVLLCSMAAMAAPRAQPPKRNGAGVEMPGVTGSTQRMGLWVGSSPSHLRASIGQDCRAAAAPDCRP